MGAHSHQEPMKGTEEDVVADSFCIVLEFYLNKALGFQ